MQCNSLEKKIVHIVQHHHDFFPAGRALTLLPGSPNLLEPLTGPEPDPELVFNAVGAQLVLRDVVHQCVAIAL